MAGKYIILDPDFYKDVFMQRIINLIDEYKGKVQDEKILTAWKDQHKKTIIKKYIIPIAYLIYSYIYTKYYDFQTKKIIRINNELNYTNYKYFFDYENPVIKKVNVFFYKEFEKIGKKDINQNLVNLNDIINGKNMIIKFIDGPLKKIIKKGNIEEKIKVEENIKNLYVQAITEFVNMVVNINEYNIKYYALPGYNQDVLYYNIGITQYSDIGLNDIFVKISTNSYRTRILPIPNTLLTTFLINNFRERLNIIKENINNNLQGIKEEDLILYSKAYNSYLLIFNILEKINILKIKDINFFDENDIKLETLLNNYLNSYKLLNPSQTSNLNLIKEKDNQKELIGKINIISNNLEYKNEIYKLLYEVLYKKNNNNTKTKINIYYDEIIKYIYQINKNIYDIDIDKDIPRITNITSDKHIFSSNQSKETIYLNKYIENIEKYSNLDTFKKQYDITDLNNENCVILFEMLFFKSLKITEYLENLYLDQITNKYDKLYKISKYINNNKFILDNLFREYKKININNEDLNNLNNKKNIITNNLDILNNQKKSINSKNNSSKELKEIEDKNNKINDINKNIDKYNKYQETMIQINLIENKDTISKKYYLNNLKGYIFKICESITNFYKKMSNKSQEVNNVIDEIIKTQKMISELDHNSTLDKIKDVYNNFFLYIYHANDYIQGMNIRGLRIDKPRIKNKDIVENIKKVNKEVENSIKSDPAYSQYSGSFTNIKKDFSRIKDDNKYYFDYLQELTDEILSKITELNDQKKSLTKDKNILDFKIKYKRSELDYLNTKIDFYQYIITKIDENITKLSVNNRTNLIKTGKDNEKKEFDEIFNQMFKLSSFYEKKIIEISYEKCVNKLYFKYEEDETFKKKIMTEIFKIDNLKTIDNLTIEMSNYFVNSNNNNIFILKVKNISTNNSNDSVKVFFKKYNEYYNELTDKIKNMLDQINNGILTINNSSKASIFTKYISRKNRILAKIEKDQEGYRKNITDKKIKVGKYTKILIYTDVLFKYLVDLLNIIDYLTFFYEKK